MWEDVYAEDRRRDWSKRVEDERHETRGRCDWKTEEEIYIVPTTRTKRKADLEKEN